MRKIMQRFGSHEYTTGKDTKMPKANPAVLFFIPVVTFMALYGAVCFVFEVLKACGRIREMHADWFSEDEGDEEK